MYKLNKSSKRLMNKIMTIFTKCFKHVKLLTYFYDKKEYKLSDDNAMYLHSIVIRLPIYAYIDGIDNFLCKGKSMITLYVSRRY